MTMDRLLSEQLITTADIAARIGVHPASVRRWCDRGATTRDGTHIRLDHVRTPGRIRTSMVAVERFLAALGGKPESEEPTGRTPAKRNRADEKAARKLEAMGI